MSISMKEIRNIAKKWDSGRIWCDQNRDLIREIFARSEPIDKGDNLKYFGSLVGIKLHNLNKIGQLDVYRQMLHQQKVGKPINFQKAKRKAEKKAGIKRPMRHADIADAYQELSGIMGSDGKRTKGGGSTNIKTGRVFGA